ncbi:MAG: UDP-2,4-diacetamido-2,4,6-trideoxy-beta-L-altropyranose hydrolase [Candidatus Omnitrophica bacterium]|nr:UDP-2,4-diacetamido-2,4,6-trideoxy-beta-L-altropyranose hydrolase [Candidatus Omnitrophota bacterium]
MVFIIRADASKKIGSGHVMRCLALAQELRKMNNSVIFTAEEMFPYLKARIKNEGFAVQILKFRVGMDQTKRLLQYSKHKHARWVILDGYNFDGQYQRILKNGGLNILSIDDIGRAKFYSDIIVNQNFSASSRLYRNKAIHSRLFLGTKYTLLREEFSRLKPLKFKQPIKQILISLGGGLFTDHYVIKILEALDETFTERLSINILLGMGGKETHGLSRTVNNSQHLIRLIKPGDFSPEIIRRSGLAISAAGSTMWELSYFGIPTVCIILSKNQEFLAVELAKRRICYNAGWIKETRASDLAGIIGRLKNDPKLRRRMSEMMKKLVDGKGRTRIARHVLEDR